MKRPKDIPVKQFSYPLSDDRIARYPLKDRDSSKLLVYKNSKISHRKFREIGSALQQGTQLVFNVSKVIHARLLFQKKTGARIEIFCLEPDEPFNYQLNFATQGSVTWKCIVGNSKKWKGESLTISDETGGNVLHARRIEKLNGEELIRFHWEPFSKTFSEMILLFGLTPIPPYLKREAEKYDSLTYQTVYSKHEGSVAAPTAGLHFTDSLLHNLEDSGYKFNEVTLHVGAGTFTPVKEKNGIDHKMHVERFHVQKDKLARLLKVLDHITPVGTTSCRTLESLYWMGVKILEDYPDNELSLLGQFEAYQLNDSYTRKESLRAILDYMDRTNKKMFFGATGIMISPGYEFKMTNCLITNFHQPASTLLMLIAALVGDKWKDIYDYALENNFRFLSYGDSSILFRD